MKNKLLLLIFVLASFAFSVNTNALTITNYKKWICTLDSTDVIEAVCYDPNQGYTYYFVKTKEGIHYKLRETNGFEYLRLVKNLNTGETYK